MKNKIILSLILLLLVIPNLAFAQEFKPVYMSLFWGDGCPHCEKERIFLKQLIKEYPNINLNEFEIYNNKENSNLLQQVSAKLGVNVRGVPFLIIGEETISGYLNDETTGEQIRRVVLKHSETGCADIVGDIISNSNNGGATCVNGEKNSDEINLPFLGTVNVKNFSLPLLTILIGAIDGFNPCAMWVLLFLISMLIGMQNRLRMWLLGGTFIVASSLTYFLFLVAWLQLFQFLSYIPWLKIIIGLVAIICGYLNIKKYFKNKNGTCEVTNDEKRRKIFDRIKNVIQKKYLLLSLVGIILLAFSVNLVELVCSAGLPAIYTGILSTMQLNPFQYYGYLLLYILFFMIDDLIVFVAAMLTLKLTGISSRYTRAANLIGGIIITLLGIILIFKPQLIMFG